MVSIGLELEYGRNRVRDRVWIGKYKGKSMVMIGVGLENG